MSLNGVPVVHLKLFRKEGVSTPSACQSQSGKVKESWDTYRFGRVVFDNTFAIEEKAQAALGSVLSLGVGNADLVELRGSPDLEEALVSLLVDNADLNLWSVPTVVIHGGSIG